MGHTTESFFNLKKIIENLIKEGYLWEYITGAAVQQPPLNADRVVNVITPKVPSVKKLKHHIYYLNKAYSTPTYDEDEKEVITFTRTELAATIELHTNSLVVEVVMTTPEVG